MRNIILPLRSGVLTPGILGVLACALTGCAVSNLTSPASDHGAKLSGTVHGGQQPVSGAAIQLYAAGLGGNGTASSALLNAPVTTDANGNFSITNDYTCPSTASQVYITASGGNPGLPGGAANSAIALVTALGDCGSLTSATSLTINEVTTVAAAWALAPFASALDHVASSPTNTAGLRNAFLNAGMLADSSLGVSPATTLPGNATIESGKVYALANLLATCVNSDGGAICSGLFNDATPAGVTLPADTFTLAWIIAENPANNVQTLYDDLPPQSPFPQTLASTPADWSVSIAYTGGGLSAPTSLALDGTGNVWVASDGGALSAFSPQGVPVWLSGITGDGLDHSFALAVDTDSNLWVSNMASGSPSSGTGSISVISPAGASLAGATGLTAGNINLPVALAADRNGNMWVANLGSSTVNLMSPSGAQLSGANGFGAGVLSAPSALAVNSVHQVWIANRTTGSLALMDAVGNILQQTGLGNLPDSLALDGSGNLWVGDSTDSTLAELDSAGNIALQPFSGGALNAPHTLVVDAANRLWATNTSANTLSTFAPAAFPLALPLSPASGLGADAGLNQPSGAGVDASGNLWVTSLGDNRLVEFIGIAAPTATPRIGLPRQP